MATQKIKCVLRVIAVGQKKNEDLGTMLIPMNNDCIFSDLVNELKKRIAKQFNNQYSNLLYFPTNNLPTIYIEIEKNIDLIPNIIKRIKNLPQVTDWNDKIVDLYNPLRNIMLIMFKLETVNISIQSNNYSKKAKVFETISMQQWTKNDVIEWIKSLYSLNNTFKKHLILGIHLLDLNGWDIIHCKNEYELSEGLNVNIVIARKLFYLIQSHLNNPQYNFTPLKNLDPVSFAIMQSLYNSYLIKLYNIPQYIINYIYQYMYTHYKLNDLSLWLDASDSKTLILDKDNHVLEWKSKSLNNITLRALEKNKYIRPSPHQRHAQNANNWSMPKLLIKDDIKHPNINGIQYSFQQTHCLSSEIEIGCILAVFKYKRINKSCTFYIFGHNRNTLGALHGSYNSNRDLADKYILGNNKNKFYLNNCEKDPSKVIHWEDEYKIATLDILTGNNNKLIKSNQIGAERTCHAFEGVIAEIIVYPRTITTFERRIIEQYFQNKYKFV